MNSFLVQVLVCSALVGLVAASEEWLSFKAEHGKTYKSRSEDAMRRKLFEQTKEQVDKFNRENPEAGYKLGINRFADWTAEERQKSFGYKAPAGYEYKNDPESEAYIDSIINDGEPVPKEVDWRKVEGRVSSVKDQGKCASDWAFAAIGVLEGQEKIHKKQGLTELSVQNLLDCPDKEAYRLSGCEGGLLVDALFFIANQGGIDDEKSYPYQAVEGSCKFNKTNVAFSDSGYVALPPGNESALEKLVAKFGPVAVAIDASFMLHYHGGIYSGRCSSVPYELNHAVLLVGYGENEKEGKYWIVKNSWGAAFGESGYLRLSRKIKNACGITNAVIIPMFFN